MAVGASTAAHSGASGAAVRSDSGRPIRTCVGCRQRAMVAELLRVAVEPGRAVAVDHTALVPDPRRRLGGRGAWVHPKPACVELAQRRRAFGRALRASGQIDATAVLEYVADGSTPLARQTTAVSDEQSRTNP